MAGANKELVEDASIPEREDAPEKEAPPKDVRGAIKAAFKEETEKANADTGDVQVERKPGKDAIQRRIDAAAKESSTKDDGEEKEEQEDKKQSLSSDESEEEKEVKEVKKDEPKIDAPPFYKNKGKALWDKLSTDDKKFLVSREEEVSRGFAQVSQRLKNVEDIERAIAPHAPAIQKLGITQGQVVSRLFEWMEGLYNPSTKLDTFKQLAQSFGVNMSQLAGNNATTDTQEATETQDGPPGWFSEFTNAVESKIGNLEQTLTSQQQQALNQYIINWAKDKPHYNAVRELMGQLIAGGAVPLKDGVVDFDGAYEAAIKLHPEVSAQIQQEATEKAAKEAEDKAKKEAKERADKLRKAQHAGSGLKPAPASALASARPNQALNGKSKTQSVRDSIKAALDEHRAS